MASPGALEAEPGPEIVPPAVELELVTPLEPDVPPAAAVPPAEMPPAALLPPTAVPPGIVEAGFVPAGAAKSRWQFWNDSHLVPMDAR